MTISNSLARRMLGGAAALAMLGAAQIAQAADTIKVGVLHSLSGTMAISETTLKDTVLMMIDEQNKKRRPARQEARGRGRRPGLELAAVRREGSRAAHAGAPVAVTFRLLDLGVAQVGAAGLRGELNGLLFYPVQYEGEESVAERVLHRRRAEPAGDPGRRLPDERRWRREALRAAGRHRLRLSAHHQQDPRGLPELQGHQAGGHHDQLHAVRSFRLAVASCRGHQAVRLDAGKKTAVVSTINGDANVPFYKELGNQGASRPKTFRSVAFSRR
jgi:urea transport system substrate-binding protein